MIGQQLCFTVSDWQQAPERIVYDIMQKFPATKLVIRSSATSEDNWLQSNAGGHTSVLKVNSEIMADISTAITQVIHSYSEIPNPVDQILVQEFIEKVKCAGVVFTRGLETGSPYYRINFDDQSCSTDSVTAGNTNHLRTVLLSRTSFCAVRDVAPELEPILDAVNELEILLDYDRLDIEFALDQQGKVHIFQVRPITVDHSEFDIEDVKHFLCFTKKCQGLYTLTNTHTVCIRSTDNFWGDARLNPAEIIGTRPRPLAFSLYRFLITDAVWAQQRAAFGYRDVGPQPLLVAFCGQPYVDIRASLNSFVPASLSQHTAEKLIQAYLNILENHPHLHDKLEFDVAFTVWTPTFKQEAQARLSPLGISDKQIDELGEGLKILTGRAITRLDTDIASVSLLLQRSQMIMASDLSFLDKAILLLEDCRSLGTPAFAHAARAGFIAISFLNSFVMAGVITAQEKQKFLNSIKTIAGEFEQDAKQANYQQELMSEFCARYGHLRPGTYDITMPAYWEVPERYLSGKMQSPRSDAEHPPFSFSVDAQTKIAKMLTQLDPNILVSDFIDYLSAAIKAREWVKFKFSYNLSKALDCFVEYGASVGLSREAISYLQFDELKQLRSGYITLSTLEALIEQRKKSRQLTKMIELPQLILSQNDFYCFERKIAQPNFITTQCVIAPSITECDKHHEQLKGAIILIPQADPGYDWLFTHGIAGLVTQYGGANSHMAIRAAELALPAAIGVGDQLYEELCKADYLHLDCALQQVRGVS